MARLAFGFALGSTFTALVVATLALEGFSLAPVFLPRFTVAAWKAFTLGTALLTLPLPLSRPLAPLGTAVAAARTRRPGEGIEHLGFRRRRFDRLVGTGLGCGPGFRLGGFAGGLLGLPLGTGLGGKHAFLFGQRMLVIDDLRLGCDDDGRRLGTGLDPLTLLGAIAQPLHQT